MVVNPTQGRLWLLWCNIVWKTLLWLWDWHCNSSPGKKINWRTVNEVKGFCHGLSRLTRDQQQHWPFNRIRLPPVCHQSKSENSWGEGGGGRLHYYHCTSAVLPPPLHPPPPPSPSKASIRFTTTLQAAVVQAASQPKPAQFKGQGRTSLLASLMPQSG